MEAAAAIVLEDGAGAVYAGVTHDDQDFFSFASESTDPIAQVNVTGVYRVDKSSRADLTLAIVDAEGETIAIHNAERTKLSETMALTFNPSSSVADYSAQITSNDDLCVEYDLEIENVYCTCLLYTSPSPRDS